MKGKNLITLVCSLLTFSLVLSGCSSTKATNTGEDSKKSVTLTVSTNVVGEQAKILEEISKKFTEKNPNIKVDFTAPGKEYENQMKVKMASNILPDVFSTHGWAKIRYGQYLLDLKDASWASKIAPSMKPIATDDTGKVYILPLDQDVSGPIYNVDLLAKYGVEVPKNFDELLVACETIKNKSGGTVTPIRIGGADSWPIGQFFDFFSTPLAISAKENSSKQLLDGSYDWTKYTELAQKFQDLQKKGYLNKDVLTAKYSDSAKAFAEGKVAFGFYGPFFIDEAKKINPNLKAGLMPIPSMVPGDTPTFVGGEKTTWGIFKGSKNIDAAKKFVEFFAEPENVAKVAASNKLLSGLDGVQVDAGELTEYYNKYKDIRVFPYFDRVYLPNGMWDVMCKNGQDLLAGGITADKFSQNMKSEYTRLQSQK